MYSVLSIYNYSLRRTKIQIKKDISNKIIKTTPVSLSILYPREQVSFVS
ncbi:hypothetical protein HMPREF9445_02608 [Bacteroides clarus YIT 12056]|uniref:Uncharacterized protein n=1 Tax=Bacteroides clarus YIT 12056 TaxID=762984 RepID=A0ABN0CLA5_9BACE|nr:hypothetical protein HMPREF9445_02608 [Bacteroides clarus YIT 12056]